MLRCWSKDGRSAIHGQHRANVEPVSLGEGLRYAGFNLRGETGQNGEGGSDERSKGDGRKCLDHDGPLSWALAAPSFRWVDL